MPDIALVGEGGQPAGHTKRHLLGENDIFNGIFVVLLTPGKELLARTVGPHKRLSVTSATIRHADEPPHKAAIRALKPIISSAPSIHHLSDQLYRLDGKRIYGSIFYAVGQPDTNAGFKWEPLNRQRIGELLAGQQPCTPILESICQQFRDQLPLN